MAKKWRDLTPIQQEAFKIQYRFLDKFGVSMAMFDCDYPLKQIKSIGPSEINTKFVHSFPKLCKGGTGVIELEGTWDFLVGMPLRFEIEHVDGKPIQGSILLGIDKPIHIQFDDWLDHNSTLKNRPPLDDDGKFQVLKQVVAALPENMDFSKLPHPLDELLKHLH